MNYFNWKKIYEVGIDDLDIHHKKIVLLTNKFYTELFSETFNEESKSIFKVLNNLKVYFDSKKEYNNYTIDNAYYKKQKNIIDILSIILRNKTYVNVISLYSLAEMLREWLVAHILLLSKSKINSPQV